MINSVVMRTVGRLMQMYLCEHCEYFRLWTLHTNNCRWKNVYDVLCYGMIDPKPTLLIYYSRLNFKT